jgi:hypothetical protein
MPTVDSFKGLRCVRNVIAAGKILHLMTLKLKSVISTNGHDSISHTLYIIMRGACGASPAIRIGREF